MGNCLVTKLKGTVDNSNIVRIGEFKVEVNISSASSIGLKTGSYNPVTGVVTPVVVRTLDDGNHIRRGGSSDDYTNTISSPSGDQYLSVELAPGNYAIAIDSKYEMENFALPSDSQVGFDINELMWSSKIANIIVNECPNIYGSIDNFINKDIRIFGLSNTKVTGNIASLRTAINMTEIYGNPFISGSVESLLEGMFANGRTSGSCVITYSTFNNILTPESLVGEFSSSMVTVKKAGNIVGTYDGSTWTYA